MSNGNYTLQELKSLWKTLSDVPVDEDGDTLDGPLINDSGEVIFESGSDVTDVWHWFEDQDKDFSVGEAINNPEGFFKEHELDISM